MKQKNKKDSPSTTFANDNYIEKTKQFSASRKLSHNKRSKSSAGFTLIEFLLVFAIFIATIGGIMVFQNDLISVSGFLEESFLSRQDAQSTIRTMVAELRSAGRSSIGGYPLEIIQDNAVAFYSNIDRDDEMERIHYFYDGTDFKKSIVNPGGNPLTYSTSTGATESLKTVLRNIKVTQSKPIYVYRGTAGTTTPSEELTIDEVELIVIRLSIKQGTGGTPPQINVSSVVSIRTLKNSFTEGEEE